MQPDRAHSSTPDVRLDTLASEILAADEDGSLADWLAATASNGTLAAYARARRLAQQADEDPDEHIDQLLRQAGYCELPGLWS